MGRLKTRLQYTSILDVLREVYAKTDDRALRSSSVDIYLERCPTRAGESALAKYNFNLEQSRARNRGRPIAPKSAYQLFKLDKDIVSKFRGGVRGMPRGKERNSAKTQAFKELWVACKGDAQLSEKYRRAAEVEERRFEEQMVAFRRHRTEVDHEYDQRNPLQ